MSSSKHGIVAKAIRALSQVESNELKATLVSTLFVFILLASYFILRHVVRAMYSLFALLFIVFYLGITALDEFQLGGLTIRNFSIVIDNVFVDNAFYLWVSVFALFHVSIFWTLSPWLAQVSLRFGPASVSGWAGNSI